MTVWKPFYRFATRLTVCTFSSQKDYILLGLGISRRTRTHQPFHSDIHYKREEKACIAFIYADFIHLNFLIPPPFYISGGDAVLTVEDTDIKVTFDNLLMFATGTDRIPALGFDPEPTLEFLHIPVNGSLRIYPEANTCGLVLRLPLHASYESFNESMILGIVQSPHFGLA